MSASSSRTEPHFASATDVAAQIARRELGCVEALDRCVARIEAHDDALNAVVVRDIERARARARELDSRPPAGPLHGVPMTVKESFDVAGLPTTFGLPEYTGNIPARSAVAVERLEAAGAVIFGKTNVPRLLLDWQSFNAVYGVTRNPWNPAFTPGGSSGGGAAALAAGLTTLEVGSDIGGSVRVPAHMTGLFGHKPTWGLLSMVGHSLAGAVTPSDISVIGPLARSAADLDVALTLLAGADPADSAATTALPPPRASALAELRVAVWPEDPAAPTDPEITAEIVALADFLRSRGAAVTFTRPAFDATENYELFVQLLAAAIAPRFGPDALAAARDRAAADPHGTSADAIMDRTFDLPHREWLVLSERRHRLRRTWNAFFRDFDVLLCPPFGTPALPHDTLTQGRSRQVTVNDQTIPYNNLGFWPGVIGAFHLPATVAPLGLTAAGLPIGVQIVGAMHADRQTIAVAAMLEAQWRSFTPPPSIDAAMPR